MAVVAPTLDTATRGQGASVETTRADGADATTQAAHIHRYAAVGGAVVAQLSVAVAAPALDAASGCQGTRVELPAADGFDPTAQAAYIDRYIALGGATVAQFPGAVAAPALDVARGGQGAGVVVTSGNLL